MNAYEKAAASLASSSKAEDCSATDIDSAQSADISCDSSVQGFSYDIVKQERDTPESQNAGLNVECLQSENISSTVDSSHGTCSTTLEKEEPITESGRVTVKSDDSHIPNVGALQNRKRCLPPNPKFLAENKALLQPKCKRTMRKRKVDGTDFQCGECAFIATTNEKLKLHEATSHVTSQDETFACCLCDFETKWNREYYKHMRLHFPGPPYRCDFDSCTAKCDRIQHLLYHRMNHTEERPYSCSFCSLRFKIKSTMIIHLRKHTGYTPFSCAECNRSFSTKGALQQHVVTHSDKRAFLCDQCGFSTKHQSHLISHRRVHAGDVLRCQMENCAYKTTKRSQLIAHMQSHMRIKTFFCEQCGQGFIAKSHLKRHQLTHVAQKPFSCDVCNYSTNRKDKLSLHVVKHHGQSSTLDVQKKRNALRSNAARVRASEGRAVEGDNVYTACVKFQQLVQQVDEQLRNRRLTKYTRGAMAAQTLNVDREDGECVDLSGAARCETVQSAMSVEQSSDC